MSFLFITTNLGNESYLKAEVALKYPELKLSYGRAGFVTFKNENEITLNDLKKYSLGFARRIFLSEAKCDVVDLDEQISHFKKDLIHRYSMSGVSLNQTPAKNNQTVLNIVEVGPDEFWLGRHLQHAGISSFPNGNPHILLPEEAPSRAYLKIAESFAEFPEPKGNILEIGCAPGGASYFMVQNHTVVGVDPAEMDPILKNFKNFHHIKKPVQEAQESDLKQYAPFSNLVVDMNLKPQDSIAYSLKLIEPFKKDLKNIYFTIKMAKESQIKDTEKFIKMFQKFGIKKFQLRQLPAHKHEFLFWGQM